LPSVLYSCELWPILSTTEIRVYPNTFL
jgi:hypothetical protein